MFCVCVYIYVHTHTCVCVCVYSIKTINLITVGCGLFFALVISWICCKLQYFNRRGIFFLIQTTYLKIA